MLPTRLGVAWTPAEAAAALSPRADVELLTDLVRLLGIPEVEPGRWDAADLLGLHDALRPWLREVEQPPRPRVHRASALSETPVFECARLLAADLAPA
jgi:hypothetical protein